jgi:hypothetical protein
LSIGERLGRTMGAAVLARPDRPHLQRAQSRQVRVPLLLAFCAAICALSGCAPFVTGHDTVPAVLSSGATGHAESVQVTFDPQQISYGRLLQIYFSVVHDPTELDRQGPDNGS